MKVFALRLTPEMDLRQSLKAFADLHQIQAGFIISAIGSLRQAHLRFADQKSSTPLPGKFEIIALHGTLSVHGLHLHGMIADSEGRAIGGHIDDGCLIYTTAEIVIGESQELVFTREMDEQTGFRELLILPKASLQTGN